jgi:L-alanine-DL-glutamate epimerase-like enolase superfamily enzyme
VVPDKLHVEVESVELPLREPFSIAGHTWDSAENVFCTVTWGESSGRGESSPNEIAGETVASVVTALSAVDLDRLSGPFDLEGVHDLLPAGSARAALDIALHDLAATIAGVSVSELLGLGGRRLPPTSVTVAIAERDHMVERARSLAAHPVLKTKVGFDGDVDAVAAIRDVYDGALRIDANQGWERDDAINRLRALAGYDIELCEQPVAAGRHDDLAAVTAESPIPIFADEDVTTASDVVALAGRVHGVNLKLRKAGGIRELVAAAAVARAHGLGVMIGCDLESGIAATAGAHVAALADFVDLDGPLLLANDPWPGVAYEDGEMILPTGPGLGVRRAG